MSPLTLPEGASVSLEEQKKVSDALAALEKDPHAPREVTLRVTLHIHNEYPRIVYRGKETRSVQDEAALAKALDEGFSDYDHEAFTAAQEA